jgi:hypothetical protein
MPDIHRRTMLLITAVDELFGTHRVSEAVKSGRIVDARCDVVELVGRVFLMVE